MILKLDKKKYTFRNILKSKKKKDKNLKSGQEKIDYLKEAKAW